jgi:hypothetical protein
LRERHNIADDEAVNAHIVFKSTHYASVGECGVEHPHTATASKSDNNSNIGGDATNIKGTGNDNDGDGDGDSGVYGLSNNAMRELHAMHGNSGDGFGKEKDTHAYEHTHADGATNHSHDVDLDSVLNGLANQAKPSKPSNARHMKTEASGAKIIVELLIVNGEFLPIHVLFCLFVSRFFFLFVSRFVVLKCER